MFWAFLTFMRHAETEEAMRLGAQIFGFAPCPVCDFLASRCECPDGLERDRLAIVATQPLD